MTLVSILFKNIRIISAGPNRWIEESGRYFTKRQKSQDSNIATLKGSAGISLRHYLVISIINQKRTP